MRCIKISLTIIMSMSRRMSLKASMNVWKREHRKVNRQRSKNKFKERKKKINYIGIGNGLSRAKIPLNSELKIIACL